ncbi:RHS repeat domain-containing protein [Chitinophaga varians]|uniref:RHS repeat domain-containing protein n=1 Tax=Chitinophaga varians TaxID=2202339 RepID=UPI00165F8E83|nr:RHS repeat-associated core domain-containing protein [Chitinophaga varians]MBC9914074.1 hypothetical protein [Chitinophaga varians]
MATISDVKTGTDATVFSATDYAPFGMQMVGRKWSLSGGYRYGFNGKENDNEVKGEGNQQDYGMRVYDPRIGKFLSVDPLTANYPDLGAYTYAADNPIRLIDVQGMGPSDPPDQSWPPRQSTGGKVAEFIYAVFYDFPFYTEKGKRYSKELLNATMPSALGTINGTASNVTFSTRSAESIGLNEEHAKAFNNTTTVSAHGSARMIGGGSSGAAPALAVASDGLVALKSVTLPLRSALTLLSNAASSQGSSNDDGAEKLSDFKEDLPNPFNGIDKKHLGAAIGDMNGRPIIDPRRGKVWDHLDDISGHMRSLNGRIRELEKLINNGKFMGGVLDEAKTCGATYKNNMILIGRC